MGFSWPVPLVTLVIGVAIVILLIAGLALGCYVYRMGKTFKLVTGTVKRVTKKPLFGCHLLFSRAFKHARPGTPLPSTPPPGTIEDVPDTCLAEIHPVQMTKILQDIFQDLADCPQICKVPRQEGAGRFFCVSGTRSEPGSRESLRAHHLENLFPEAHDKGNYPVLTLLQGQWGMTFTCPWTSLYSHKNRKQFLLTLL